MIGIVLISHGAFAQGLLNAASMLYGGEQCSALGLEPADSPEEFQERLENAVDEADKGDGVFILADLYGGTPCNRAVALLAVQAASEKKKKLRLLAGANLPMLISLMDARLNDTSFDELAETVLSEAASAMTDVSAIMKKEGFIND